MKLLAIVLCLLSERYLVHRFSMGRFYWFNAWLQKITELSFVQSFSARRWLLLLLILAPLLLAGATLFFIFQGWLYGFVGFLLNVAVFYYCLGPVNPFYPLVTEGQDNETQVGDYFYQVNRQLFSPILWFILIGPIGLLCYRLLTLCQDFQPVSEEAKTATDILEWIPVRMTAFLCMLVGNFQQGLIPFKKLFFSKSANNYQFLRSTTLEALRSYGENSIEVPLAQDRVDQALVVLLVILALCTNFIQG